MPQSEQPICDPKMGIMKRCFLPIGQGAFYCERFRFGENKFINVVFDCGALPFSSMCHALGDALTAALGDDKTIHLMFLSHLHEDHVNGVEVLRTQYQITINEIRYPAIEDSHDKLLMKYWFLSAGQENGLACALCMDQPHGDAYPRLLGTNLVPIPASPPPKDPVMDDRSIQGTLNLLNLAEVAKKSGFDDEAIRNSALPEWEFRAFNYLREEDRKRLLEKLAAILPSGAGVTNENLEKLWKTQSGKRAIKKAYETLPGGFNANSMTVFSGPLEKEGVTWYQQLECCHKPPCPINAELVPTAPGCLYTGDYEASNDEHWDALAFRYHTRWESIGCLQVPHHGACLNFNKQFLCMNAIFVASAGAHNKYGHPNACVQLAFQQAHKHLFCVTEFPSSCLCTIVHRLSDKMMIVEEDEGSSKVSLKNVADCIKNAQKKKGSA